MHIMVRSSNTNPTWLLKNYNDLNSILINKIQNVQHNDLQKPFTYVAICSMTTYDTFNYVHLWSTFYHLSNVRINIQTDWLTDWQYFVFIFYNRTQKQLKISVVTKLFNHNAEEYWLYIILWEWNMSMLLYKFIHYDKCT